MLNWIRDSTLSLLDWVKRTTLGDDRGVSEPVQTQPEVSAPRSRYSMGSSANLVRSLLAILAAMAVLFFMVPRVNSVNGPPVDIHTEAVAAAELSGLPFVEAVGLPEGWRPTSARYVRSTSELMTWHAGYQTPTGTYVAIEQTKKATVKWVGAQTSRAVPSGTISIGGKDWTRYIREFKVQNSLLNKPADPNELTWLVTGDASFEEMQTFIGYLQPAIR